MSGPLVSLQSEAGQVGLRDERVIESDSFGSFPVWMAPDYISNFQLDVFHFTHGFCEKPYEDFSKSLRSCDD